ncbi:MAG: hypothetical protein OXP07_08800 [Defluviicoccus sp.]|nr:hypothetical protein [Defluviicoccus sp.]
MPLTRWSRRSSTAAAAAIAVACAVLAAAAAADTGGLAMSLSGRLALEGRWFPEEAAHPGQRDATLGYTVQSTLHLDHENGASFILTPFYRYDSADAYRTHADLREAYLLAFGELGDGEWEARLGFDRVFWGVTEFHHLVNIVNQADLVEHPNEEIALGQLMAHLTWTAEWGTLEFFVLPLHRERTLPGRGGRLRGGLPVDERRATYESAAEEWHIDLAARFSRSFGPLDLGLSLFDGTAREPSLRPSFRVAPDGMGGFVPVPHRLVPHYAQIRQYGLDAQLTLESWLLKLEAIHREGAPALPDPPADLSGRKRDYRAFVAGFEYTFGGVFESNADISVLAEWSYDERERRSPDQFQNEIFVAGRLALNDVEGTQLVASLIADADYETYALGFEIKRNLSDSWDAKVDGTVFLAVDPDDPIHDTRRDSYIGGSLVYSF